ncbi:MAG: hypothetical protein MRECE_10c016 [Mycoplasmataceae bacterium CE_OT135]|nr:MAG: hypothetical protein MRECE_15c004 [Mycoplasmataceae bacterium CE_OT135]KLL03712.1 MAG: hypothetical protein MRECE_10c016 [Mycoplasmataceae bacterium CE_OT135]
MELKKRADQPSPEFPENFKFKIMARNLENPAELVRLDNHQGKSPHYHLDNQQTYFTNWRVNALVILNETSYEKIYYPIQAWLLFGENV